MLDRQSFEEVSTLHIGKLQDVLSAVDRTALFRVHARLCTVRDSGRMVFLAGNGGSAATASHWANDLGKSTKRSGRPSIRVMSLADNTPWLTALANDDGFETVFAGQLDALASAGDLLVVFSASGNSANLLRAIEVAKRRGLVTVGFVGFDGGRMRTLVDDVVFVPTEVGAYELVEDAHMVLASVLTRSLIADVVARPDSVQPGAVSGQKLS